MGWMQPGPSIDASIAAITPEIIDQYERDGVVMVPNALHPEWLMLIEIGLSKMLADPTQGKFPFYAETPEQFLELLRSFDSVLEIQRLLYDSPIADMIAKLIGSEDIWYYSDEFFVKDGGGAGRTPWHQDMPYWPLTGNKIASMWITLDPLPREECLEYVRGSHKGAIFDGFDPGRVVDDPTAPHYGKEYPPLPDIEAARSDFDIVAWDMSPGDVILAHPSTLHGGGPTGPDGRRRAITIRLYGDDIVYAERPDTKPTAPFTPGLGLALSPGDALRHPWYPQIRPVPAHQRIA